MCIYICVCVCIYIYISNWRTKSISKIRTLITLEGSQMSRLLDPNKGLE